MIVSRRLTYLNASMYAVLGAILFLLPTPMASVFAWKVTSFMTMTIGGWCLGNAWLAWLAARRWQWSLVYPALIYLWLFGALELAVVVAFRDKLVLAHPIAWFYLITLGVNALAAIVGVIEWLRARPTTPLNDVAPTSALRFLIISFVLLVGFLGLYGLVAQIGDLATKGEIFPEIMSLFTLRSFGAFYFCLALAVVPLIRERHRQAVLNHAWLAYGFIIFITLAAFVNLPVFDFNAHPFQTIYIGIYLLAGSLMGFFLVKYGTGAPRAQASGD